MRRLPLALLALVLLAVAAPAGAAPRCFGAASRDADRPCVNPRLKATVEPAPDDAPLELNVPCTVIRRSAPQVCASGVAPGRATATVALIGDSHGAHWRPAVTALARARRWRVLSITRDACPFTFAQVRDGKRCRGWARSVVRWLRPHPEVELAIVSNNAGHGVYADPGKNATETKLDGLEAALAALPGAIDRTAVLHDVPRSSVTTQACVASAHRRRRNAGVRCARPIERALPEDPTVLVAQRMPEPRPSVIDLTPFMCDDTRCFPVVGGALVIRDIGHLTTAFSTSLGPYLGRALSRLP